MLQTLTNLSELSEAKESGGLLRANTSALIARNTRIDFNENTFIQKLNNKFIAFSQSPAVNLFNSESEKI